VPDEVAERCRVAVRGAGLELELPARDDALEVERRELVRREVARERRERERGLPVIGRVVECVRLGPRLADLPNVAEARAFFTAARLRSFVWWASAAFLVGKDFLLRLPSGDSQSA